MYCPHCKVYIECRTTECPLCHEKIAEVDSREFSAAKKAFPKRGKPDFLGTSTFDTLYIIIALNLSIAVLASEYIIAKEVRYFYFAASFMFYLYFLIRSTIQNTNFFSQKVVAQAVALTIVAFSVSSFVTPKRIIYELILPLIYLISMVMIGIYIITRFKASRKHLTNLISVALLAFFPFGVVMFSGREAMPNIILSVATATLGGVIILSTLLFYSKAFIREVRRIFHI